MTAISKTYKAVGKKYYQYGYFLRYFFIIDAKGLLDLLFEGVFLKNIYRVVLIFDTGSSIM